MSSRHLTGGCVVADGDDEQIIALDQPHTVATQVRGCVILRGAARAAGVTFGDRVDVFYVTLPDRGVISAEKAPATN